MRTFLAALLISLTITAFSPAADEVKQAMDDARKFAEAGEPAKALERHEWIHANTLRVNPAYRGVRLSFALNDWVTLGKTYPPALTSLEKIRAEDVRQLEAGNAKPDLFQDVVAINRSLAQQDQTISLFKKLEGSHPELAKRVSFYALDLFLESREYALFQRYVTDPADYLSGKVTLHDSVIKMVRQKDPGSGFIEQSDQQLVDVTLTLVKMAQDQGDPALAAKLKALTFKSVTDPRLAP